MKMRTDKIKSKVKRLLFKMAVLGYVAFVLSLGITYAVGGNQLQISGSAYFLWQDDDSDRIPTVPIDVDGNGNFFVPMVTGEQNINIIEQHATDGNLYLSICTANSNNGNTTWSIQFQIANPTVAVWTDGRTVIESPIPGGRPNHRFSFNSAVLSPINLEAGHTATVNLNMTSQLGQADAGGSANIYVYYTIQGVERVKIIHFTYVPRQDPACPLP
jgi:hypothetical protein